MNRSTRRAQKHRKSQPRWNKAAAHTAINMLMLKHSVDDPYEYAGQQIMLPAYAVLENLLADRLDHEGYWRMQEVVMYAYLLAARLHEFAANDATRALLHKCEAGRTARSTAPGRRTDQGDAPGPRAARLDPNHGNPARSLP